MKKKNPKKKKKKINRRPEWLKRIPINTNKLTLDELRNFKEVDNYLTGAISGSKSRQYFIRCYRYLTAFAIACVAENRYPPLTKCWNDLDKLFMREKIFEDGLFVQAWIFINFECGNDSETLIELFDEFISNDETEHNFSCFFSQMKNTRFGIYEEIISSHKIIKFRELITGDVINVHRSIKKFEKGELFLARLVEYKDETFIFGDPKCWPNEHKSVVEGFLNRKMTLFNGKTDREKYNNLMTKAGPYWMSCVSQNNNIPILDPFYYLQYYET